MGEAVGSRQLDPQVNLKLNFYPLSSIIYPLSSKMYSTFEIGLKYLWYQLTASNGKGHGMHSPFVYQFIRDVLNDETKYPEYEKVEAMRNRLLHDHSILEVLDLGAGSLMNNDDQRKVSDIARFAAKPPRFAQLLFRMIRKYKPSTIIELGTSLGITTSYMALADPNAKVITIEGAPAIGEYAKNNFRSIGIENIEVHEGDFGDQLSEVLNKINNIDLVFIDGNHQKEPTENYFSQLLEKRTNDSIFIFDDIHWSREMEEAWENIKEHDSVRCTIDLFFLGIVLFRAEFKEVRHFKVRF